MPATKDNLIFSEHEFLAAFIENTLDNYKYVNNQKEQQRQLTIKFTKIAKDLFQKVESVELKEKIKPLADGLMEENVIKTYIGKMAKEIERRTKDTISTEYKNVLGSVPIESIRKKVVQQNNSYREAIKELRENNSGWQTIITNLLDTIGLQTAANWCRTKDGQNKQATKERIIGSRIAKSMSNMKLVDPATPAGSSNLTQARATGSRKVGNTGLSR